MYPNNYYAPPQMMWPYDQQNQQPIQPRPNNYPQQMMQPQPQAVRVPILGRVVDSLEEVTPNDVPMDGSISFFPLRDNSCIYAKAWSVDGKINTFQFVPFIPEEIKTETAQEPNQFETIILERLDKIEKMLSTTQPAPVKKTTASSKKEATNE